LGAIFFTDLAAFNAGTGGFFFAARAGMADFVGFAFEEGFFPVFFATIEPSFLSEPAAGVHISLPTPTRAEKKSKYNSNLASSSSCQDVRI
jgi:hypothetical protein